LVRVKICGLRDATAVRAAVDHGADAVGFVVKSPKSPRNIELDLAEELILKVPPFVHTVVVTASPSVDEVLEAANRLRPDSVQLHSQMGLNSVSTISKKLRERGTRVIGALAVEAGADYSELMIRDLVSKTRGLAGEVEALVVDSAVGGSMGGTGVKSNLKIVRYIRDAVAPFPLILAGGLTPENVVEAVAMVDPYAVDVSSGVERSPGVKDLSKIKAFIERVRRLD